MNYEPNDDEPRWLSALYFASWTVLWVFAGLVVLMLCFGLAIMVR